LIDELGSKISEQQKQGQRKGYFNKEQRSNEYGQPPVVVHKTNELSNIMGQNNKETDGKYNHSMNDILFLLFLT